MLRVRRIDAFLCIVLVAGFYPAVRLAAEEHRHSNEIPASIGTCHQPDFFLLNMQACPEEVTEGQIPHCGFSAFRYRPDRAYHSSSVEELIGSLRPGVPVCFFIHGAFVSWDFTAQESPEHYCQIVQTGGNRPLHFIAVHWPSEFSLWPCPPLKLVQLERRADAFGHCLAQFLARIPPENPVCLLGHSYGTRVICRALQDLSRGVVSDPVSPATGCRRRIRAVFTVSSIDHHWLNPGEEFENAIDRVECLLIFTNLLDPAMQVYYLNDPLLHHPLGQVGLTCIDRKKLGWQADKITEKNVTLVVGCGHAVVKYFSQPVVMKAKIPYIYFD